MFLFFIPLEPALAGIKKQLFIFIVLLEAIFQITVYGFLFNGNMSYVRYGWNLVDLIIVIVSIVGLGVPY